MYAHHVSKEEADKAVERVFPVCYNDLEPIGRRMKRNSDDRFRALKEARLYGYVWWRANWILYLMQFWYICVWINERLEYLNKLI